MSKDTTPRQFDSPLQIRVSAQQMELFRQAAKADGRPLSNWARERLEKIAKKELAR
jgi:hypothetical protein